MRYRVEDFPFRIRDVAELMGINPTDRAGRSRSGSYKDQSWYCNCVFCGHKGKLNINFTKNVFNCNYCGEHGGMLELYGRYYNLSNREAFEEICSGLHMEKPQQSEFRAKVPQPENRSADDADQVLLASETEINKTYSMLLSLLTLSEKHQQDLLNRGLTLEQIAERRYRSTPVFGYKQIVQKLIQAGCVIQGVPGFYQDKDGKWSMNFSSRGSGFLVPMESIDGHISGMQIRLDHPRDGQKYIWFSSVNKENGVSSGSPLHFIGNLDAEAIYITEGGLKGSIAHYLSGETFLCVAGITQYKNIPAILEELKFGNLKHVNEAYDMDKLMHTEAESKECQSCEYKLDCHAFQHYLSLPKDMQSNMVQMTCPRKMQKRSIIQKGCTHVYEICQELNLTYTRCVWDMNEGGEWNGQIKGIDDYLYEQKHNIG